MKNIYYKFFDVPIIVLNQKSLEHKKIRNSKDADGAGYEGGFRPGRKSSSGGVDKKGGGGWHSGFSIIFGFCIM